MLVWESVPHVGDGLVAEVHWTVGSRLSKHLMSAFLLSLNPAPYLGRATQNATNVVSAAVVRRSVGTLPGMIMLKSGETAADLYFALRLSFARSDRKSRAENMDVDVPSEVSSQATEVNEEVNLVDNSQVEEALVPIRWSIPAREEGSDSVKGPEDNIQPAVCLPIACQPS